MVGDRSGTIARAGACALAALCVFAAPATAASALTVKAGLYAGTLGGGQSKITLSFRVSAAGAVTAVKISALPIYCSGNGPPGTPSIVFAKARVDASGRFTTKGKDMIASGPLKGSVAATLSLSGAFAAGGRVRGTLTTSYGGPAKSCGGHSSFSAHA